MPDERDIDPVHIGDRAVGPGEPAYVIAEAGANHDGELAKAKRLVDAAVESGADAVKFQNYSADRLVTRDAPKYWGEGTQYETFAELDVLEREDYEAMAAHARERGITYLSTPFDGEAVDLLDDLDVPAYKIASGDLTHHPLLRDVASRGDPVILSTGMATLGEIRAAVDVIEDAGNEEIVLLHCITRYPTDIEDANLRMMETLMAEFDYPVGLSDHTIGTTVPVAAAAMGAAVIEKHFTYDTSLEKSPDHRLSADVAVMSEIVDRTREVHAAMGRAEQGPTAVERDGMRLARRSLVTDRAIAAGERIRRADLAVKRPGTGLAPELLFEVDEGDWRATRDLEADVVLTAADVDGLPDGVDERPAEADRDD